MPSYAHHLYFSGSILAGVIVMRDRTHVHHLFVDPAFQRKGIASQLWRRARDEALDPGVAKVFSVRSSVLAVPVYARFGFLPVGGLIEKDGLTFAPMELRINAHPSDQAR